MDQTNNRSSLDPLTIKSFDDLTFMPIERTPKDGLGMKFGAFSSDGMPLESFRLRRFYDMSKEPDFKEADTRVDESVTYGGVLFAHFGHFLLESLSRVWCHRESRTGSIIWHAQADKLRDWQEYIFWLLGVPVERFAYIKESTRFREVTLPDPGFEIGLSFHPLHADALAAFPCFNPQPRKRIWLSRTKLPSHKGHVLEESQIEQRLQERGWDIVYPETLPIAEQLDHLASAATVAGFEGSAFHTLLLLRDCKAEVRIIGRGGKPNPNYELIASAKGLRQKILILPLTVVSGKGNNRSWKLSNVDEVIDFVN